MIEVDGDVRTLRRDQLDLPTAIMDSSMGRVSAIANFHRSSKTSPPIELTILMPCLNEARTLASCIAKAHLFLRTNGVHGEVLVADNGSSDDSIEIGRSNGARVINVREKGYGSALLAGIASARGRYVVMGDADDSYDFSALDPFLVKLRAGADLVIGNRYSGGIASGAMPVLHRYLGNPVLSFIGRLLFATPIRDFHCGLRAFRRDAIVALTLREHGMEFASEMVVKASLARLQIEEVPTMLAKDGRDRAPHLRTWRDGWRHLRFLLMLSPRWALLYPGLLMLAVGWAMQALLLPGPLFISGVGLDIHTMLFSAGIGLVGGQLCLLALLARCAAIEMGLLPRTGLANWFLSSFRLEPWLAFAALLIAISFGCAVYATNLWKEAAFAAVDPSQLMRPAILSVSLGVSGFEMVVGAIFMSLIQYASRRREPAEP